VGRERESPLANLLRRGGVDHIPGAYRGGGDTPVWEGGTRVTGERAPRQVIPTYHEIVGGSGFNWEEGISSPGGAVLILEGSGGDGDGDTATAPREAIPGTGGFQTSIWEG
jgi:hypothetical protein